MPASFTTKKRTKLHGLFATVSEGNLGTYATGGVSVTPQQFGLQAIELVLISPAGGYLFEFDYANGKIKALNPMPQHTHDLLITGGQAAADALQVSATVVGKTAAGNVTAAGGASNIQNRAAAVAAEVANATDLSGVQIRVMAFGL